MTLLRLGYKSVRTDTDATLSNDIYSELPQNKYICHKTINKAEY